MKPSVKPAAHLRVDWLPAMPWNRRPPSRGIDAHLPWNAQSDEAKRSICLQTTAPDVSVAQVARRYGLNANLIFKWLRDARYTPGSAQASVDRPCFLPVEIVEQSREAGARPALPSSLLEVDLAGGHRLRISGAYDPEALARLIRGLSG